MRVWIRQYSGIGIVASRCLPLKACLVAGINFFKFPATPSASTRQGKWLIRPDSRPQIEVTLFWVPSILGYIVN